MATKTHQLTGAKGYRIDFLNREHLIPLPELSERQQLEIAPVKGNKDNILHYHNYSVIQNAKRRFPFFTAANIDGEAFKDLNRSDIFPGGRDRWRKDRRISYSHQWGMELYRADKSDFDRGHMTRREDVQWGKNMNSAKNAAQTTYFFTNSVPQHPALNQDIWSNLEDYLLHHKSVAGDLRINLFTGPALRKDDPLFVTPVREEDVQIPVYFWKVIYYRRGDGTIGRTGFIMSQKEVLELKKITKPAPVERGLEPLPEDIGFMDFEEAETYQVPVELIEKLTDMRFAPAADPLQKKRPAKLDFQKFEVPVGTRSLDGSPPKTFEIEGLQL